MKLSRRGLFKALGGLGLAALVGQELPLAGTPISGNLVNGGSHVNSFGTLNIGSGSGGAGANFIPEIWSRSSVFGNTISQLTVLDPIIIGGGSGSNRRLSMGHYSRVKRG